MVGFALQPDQVVHAERLGHLLGQLQPACPVEYRVLHGVVCHLAVIALAALGSAAGHAGEAPPAQGGSAVVIDNPLASHSLDELAATRDRPLFAPGRRPPAPPAVVVAAPPAPPPPSPPPDLALLGTIVEANGASALVRGAPSEKPSHVRVGDVVDGWSIAEIGERQIVLSLDERSVTFTMFNGGRAAGNGVVAGHRLPPVLEVNSRGILTARRITKSNP